MSDVDYSEFYYRQKSVPRVAETNRRYEDDNKPVKKRVSAIISTVLIILILFGIAFFAADFFMKGQLITGVKSAFRGNDYQYYLVVGDCSSRDRAYAQSLLVKQGGGSGYIISGEKFSVVYSPFTNRAEADVVAEKNKDTYVFIVEFSSKEVDFYNSFFTEIDNLINVVADFEKGKVTDSEFYSAFNIAKTRIKDLDDGKITDDKRAVIEYAVGGIEGLDFAKGAKTSLMSDARYVLSGIIISLQKTA